MIFASLLAFGLLASPRVDLDVVYAQVAGEELKMDIYFPERGSAVTSPGVVVFHGGAWITGKRQEMAEMAIELSKAGFVAATASYRLAPKHKWPAMLDDAQTAVRYLRSRAAELKIDPAKIGSCGASAGGHLALLVGFKESQNAEPFKGLSSQTQAVFNIFGPTDLRRDFPATLDPLIGTVLGKKKQDSAEDIRLASPVEWITAKSPPVFTLHGDADPLVPVAQAKWLKEKLDAAKIRNELVIVSQMGHGINSATPAQREGVVKGIDFLKSVLAK